MVQNDGSCTKSPPKADKTEATPTIVGVASSNGPPLGLQLAPYEYTRTVDYSAIEAVSLMARE